MTLPAGVTLRDVFNAMEALYMATPRNKPFRQLSVAQRAKLETEVMAVFDSLADRVVVPNWQSIESAPKGVKVIAGQFNPLGKWRSFMATYYLVGTLDSSEYNDGGDEDGFAPEGWYEESETHDEILPIAPSHWLPLFPAPATADLSAVVSPGEQS